jgi:NAD(P)-dependent dehydrogenase (short-subunit alcohol dehydrogenase family)
MSLNILVTGSSRGIGAAIVDALPGHNVVGHATSCGRRAHRRRPVAAGAAPALWNEALERLGGRIDVLVNNAGVFEAAPIGDGHEAWLASWERTMTINLTASAELCRLAVLHFGERGGGRIVNVASRAAYRGDSPAHWHYAASKAGMVAMTKTIARAYASGGVLAFAVCPGFTMTGMAEDYLASRGGDRIAGRHPARPRRRARRRSGRTVAWLATDAPASMTGAVLDINGASYVR